jgi:hypothetical protein
MSSVAQHHFDMGCRAGRRGTPAEVRHCCKVCGDDVLEGTSTDTAESLQTCRDQKCIDGRIFKLIAAEQELTKLKRDMKAHLLTIATFAEHHSKDCD